MTDIVFLDGGLGQEINKRSPNDSHPLWSVKVMFDAPEIVEAVHRDFINAGARVISVNTYTATPTRMQREGFGERFLDAHTIAIEIVRRAITRAEKADGSLQVAGCLPPLVASYVSEVSKDYQASLTEYRQIVEAEKNGVDVFLIETMSNITEASAAIDAAQASGKPVYVGLTLSDDCSDTLRSGEQLSDAIGLLSAKKPDGILLNCSIPEAITQAMPILADSGLPFGGYANGFTSIDKLKPGGTVDVLQARKDLPPETYADIVEHWIKLGATIVGGCCEVGPVHIRYLADRLMASGFRLTAFPSKSSP